jgi:hypothetical protein
MANRPLIVMLGILLVLVGIYAVFRGITRLTTPINPAAAVTSGDASPEEGEQTGGGPGWALAGGVLLAAGSAAIGIGIGRWGRSRPPHSEADFTGPGKVGDHPRIPPTV